MQEDISHTNHNLNAEMSLINLEVNWAINNMSVLLVCQNSKQYSLYSDFIQRSHLSRVTTALRTSFQDNHTRFFTGQIPSQGSCHVNQAERTEVLAHANTF